MSIKCPCPKCGKDLVNTAELLVTGGVSKEEAANKRASLDLRINCDECKFEGWAFLAIDDITESDDGC